MSEFSLPSGRVLQLKERASYGDLCDAQDTYKETGKLNAFNVSLMVALSGLAIDEIRELDIDDGRALEEEMNRRAGKRSVEDERPFATPSGPSSTDATPTVSTSTPEPSAA